MKWKLSDYEKGPELSSDIEWMLQSGQVSRAFFLETLTGTYYVIILRLATSLLDDTTAAREATRKTFLQAVMDVHRYRSQVGVETWLYRIAYQTCVRVQQRERIWKGIERVFSLKGELTNPASEDPPSKQDHLVWQAVDRLGDPARNILILQFANGWNAEQIAAVTEIDLAQVNEIIEQAQIEISKEILPLDESLEAAFSRSLGMRWPITHPTIEETHEYARSIERKAGGRHSVQRRVTTLKEMAIIGLAILLVFLMIWGGNRFFLRSEEGSGLPGSASTRAQNQSEKVRTTPEKRLVVARTQTPFPSARGELLSPRLTSTPTPTGVFYTVQEGDTLAEISAQLGASPDELIHFNRIPDGAVLSPGKVLVIPGSLPDGRVLRATPVTPVAHRIPVKQPETSADVLHLLNPDIYPFNTLWLEAELLSYPSGYESLPATRSRFQVWLSQRQFLMVGGLLGEEPEEVGIGSGGRFYVSKPGSSEFFFKDLTSSYDQPPMSVPVFFGLMMLFGESDEIAYSNFSVLGESIVAGREVWVVDQSSKDGNRQAFLWLDKETGFSLHVRRLDVPSMIGNLGQYRPREVIVKAIAYDVDFPQELFNYALPWRGGYAQDYTGEPASIGDNRSTLPEDGFASQRTTQTLPEDIDLSLSRLSFAFPAVSDSQSTMDGTDIYADGQYLGQVQMGVPWDADCRRSKNGLKIVYSRIQDNSGGSVISSDGIYYVDLRRLDEVYQLLPADGDTEGDFAISPDNRTVAYWGCSGSEGSCEVYLHDMETHQSHKLVDNQEGVGDFVWSPDGELLAWMTSDNGVSIVEVSHGKIIYSTDREATTQTLNPDLPLKDWKVGFPPQHVGLEGCILPPVD